jgi:hypothetical protein
MEQAEVKREYGAQSVPCCKLIKMIHEKLERFAIEGYEYGFTVTRVRACESAQSYLKEAMIALTMADSASKKAAAVKVKRELAERMKTAPMFQWRS